MESKNVEKIVTEVGKVFLRYGFRRTTMADLAKAAQMSRPAFYLIFPSKEEAFLAVVKRFIAENLEEIRRGIPRFKTVEQKLTFAFDVWFVRPFEMIRASPDASDILESGSEIACKEMAEAKSEFEAMVADVLKLLVREQSKAKLSARKIAEILCRAAHGFKGTARDVGELRQMLHDHLTLVLTGLAG
ncbi:MAG TPA: TetR/AcrR family transcriptional regulator [Candidatus Sulfotelmatobacter sp.]|nr:TetR/AcrR family transcriptional regulator [Candidatus Sulfotelmatobacter sp.]